MQLRRPAGIYQVFLMGVLVLATIVFTGRQHYGEAHNADEDQHAHHQTERVCRGFVVLPNGFAVLSSLPLSSAYASVGERQSTAHSGITIANTDHTADAPEYLLGYTHGQKIVLQDAMLCVPIVGAGTLKWTAVSHTAALLVIVESPKDTLLHGHRTNAAFTLTIRQGAGLSSTPGHYYWPVCRSTISTCQGGMVRRMTPRCRALSPDRSGQGAIAFQPSLSPWLVPGYSRSMCSKALRRIKPIWPPMSARSKSHAGSTDLYDRH